MSPDRLLDTRRSAVGSVKDLPRVGTTPPRVTERSDNLLPLLILHLVPRCSHALPPFRRQR